MKLKQLGILALGLVLTIVIVVAIIMLNRKSQMDEVVLEVHFMFPTISHKSAEKFAKKVIDWKLTYEEVWAWASELASKGEAYLPENQQEEMASLRQKAVAMLPPEQQTVIQTVDTKISLGQQPTVEEQKLVSTYLVLGIDLLNEENRDRYFYLRTKALEEALKRE